MTTLKALSTITHLLIEQQERPLFRDEEADLKICMEIVEHDLYGTVDPVQEAAE